MKIIGSPVRVGIVGTGFMGQNHLRHLLTIPGVRVTGVFDLIIPKARETAEKFGVPWFAELDPLLEQSDAVVVCVPTTSHFSVTKSAIAKGCHVFVEKPFMHTLEEARSICRMVRDHSVLLQVGHVERFSPVVRKLFETFRPDELVSVEFQRFVPLRKRLDVNVMLALMIHDLDLLLKMAQTVGTGIRFIQATSISAHSHSVRNGLSDNLFVQIGFDRPMIALLQAVRTGALRRRCITVTERNRTLSADLLHQKLFIQTRKDSGSHEVEEQVVHAGTENALLEEMKHFVHCVQTGQKPEVNERDGLETMLLADRIQRNCKELTLPEKE
ncbi:Gfo/Idh/MocA family protein [Staphylospora marina]|uniref:Gfo/Idh/MocA family protein n=1 Tax=Staphylospora marina TaxID=2490858 RepID=UPI0013DE7523|nr:Gfo/Idh/MocA family oxidoreductase [Staphylospora marina]